MTFPLEPRSFFVPASVSQCMPMAYRADERQVAAPMG